MHDSVSALVTLRLVYLARLREAFGGSGEHLRWVAEETPTVAGVIDVLRRRGGAWAVELADGRAIRFAVNQRLVPRERTLADGDEVAILPPVTGG
jgi:molybdopterin synthase sulfur carrier subunit